MNRFPNRTDERYQRTKDRLDLPMTVLAAALGVLLIFPLVTSVSPVVERRLAVIGWVLWAIFVAEYLLLLALSPKRMQMIRDHPLELLLIVVPIFRPLKALRVVRIFVGAWAAHATLARIMGRKGLHWFSVAAAVTIGIGAIGVLLAERHDPASQITNIGDALWWAIVTCTTVGYGDLAPITPAGRVIAVALMVLGISIISVVTANIASALVDEDAESDIARLEAKIDALTEQIERYVNQSTGPPNR